MILLKRVLPAIALAGALVGSIVYAQSGPEAGTGPGAGHHSGHRHRDHGLFGMGYVLHQLNLTGDQKTQIQAILAGEKSQFEALRSSMQANRAALASTPPTDDGYPALIATAQANASQRITLASSTWSQIYTAVLTDPQRQAIPGIVASAQANRAAQIAAWRAAHPQP